MDASAVTASVVDHAHGISTVDSRYIRPGLDAIHLIAKTGLVAVVDSGTNDPVPRLFAAVVEMGTRCRSDRSRAPSAYASITRAAKALLMSGAPNAKLVVHARGARHMIDPSKPRAATGDVHADAASATYGIVPVPVERVVETRDATVALAGRTLTSCDTPGHARHHNGIDDAGAGHLFVGDVFGVSYRELDRDGMQFVFPLTTATQFDPDVFHDSIHRMLALRPDAVYLTHSMRVVDEAARQPEGIAPDTVDTVLAMDIELDANGLEAWITSGGAGTPSLRVAA